VPSRSVHPPAAPAASLSRPAAPAATASPRPRPVPRRFPRAAVLRRRFPGGAITGPSCPRPRTSSEALLLTRQLRLRIERTVVPWRLLVIDLSVHYRTARSRGASSSMTTVSARDPDVAHRDLHRAGAGAAAQPPLSRSAPLARFDRRKASTSRSRSCPRHVRRAREPRPPTRAGLLPDSGRGWRCPSPALLGGYPRLPLSPPPLGLIVSRDPPSSASQQRRAIYSYDLCAVRRERRMFQGPEPSTTPPSSVRPAVCSPRQRHHRRCRRTTNPTTAPSTGTGTQDFLVHLRQPRADRITPRRDHVLSTR